jgi:CheY-like chemotaxis protein/anti-sigma regulatory factor (Ser/Thr protein kinase)
MNNAILFVDDTRESLRLLTDILIAEGYNVRPADSGMLALASAKANPPELILLDIRMPGIDGYEVCRQLKQSDITRDIPVIFVSAASEVEERVEGWLLGAVDFITKPYQREELLVRVRTHLDLARLHSRLERLVQELTAELSEANERLLKSALFQKKFLRDLLSNVSDGVLELCYDENELPAPLIPFGEPMTINAAPRLRELREWIRNAGAFCNLDDDRIFDLIVGVHEAAMNAITHAGKGDKSQGKVQARIEDKGAGITLDRLPRAAITEGSTSTGPLGHGMKRMLSSVDCVYLMTGSSGTTIVIEQNKDKCDAELGASAA